MAKQNLYQWRSSTLEAMIGTRDRILADIDGLQVQAAELNSIITALQAIELSQPDPAPTVAPVKASAKASAKPTRIISEAGKRAIAKAARAMWRRRKAAARRAKNG